MDQKGMGNGVQKIDLRKVFRQKNPRLAPYIPGFVYRYLNRILHIAEINGFLEVHGHEKNYEFIVSAIREFNVTTEIIGTENLPGSGRVIFASNHPLGGFDGMLLMKMIVEKYHNVRSISNDILMNIENVSDYFVPINKHGVQDAAIVKGLNEIMDSGIPVLTFPAGLVSRKRKGIIRDVEWKKSFISKAVQYRRNIIPVHITGRCTDFFYNLARLRKCLGIKANLEMFYLPDETFRHKNKHFTITIGPMIPWETFTAGKKPSEWALRVRDYVYTLPGNFSKPFIIN